MIIRNFLDNDLYKFTMQQAVYQLYPWVNAEYTFNNRGKTEFPEGFLEKLHEELWGMRNLKLTEEDQFYLEETCYFFNPAYLESLRNFRYNPNEVSITQDGGDLSVSIKGPWFRTILWEVPLMAIISELYFKMTKQKRIADAECERRNMNKIEVMRECRIPFADFGTRRRYSHTNHKRVLEDFVSCKDNTLVGTSNVHFAKMFGITPIGTQAHEWFMFHAVDHGYKLANVRALDAWARVYRGQLGIALTDTYTSEQFFKTFNTVHAKLFDGVRHDSGDPFKFADKVIEHYEKLRIDPKTKTIVFSDGLSISKAIDLHEHCEGRIKDSYGIGTHLTNDVGVTPLNIVIKLSKTNSFALESTDMYPVVKLSDDEGKHTGDKEEVQRCLSTLRRDVK